MRGTITKRAGRHLDAAGQRWIRRRRAGRVRIHEDDPRRAAGTLSVRLTALQREVDTGTAAKSGAATLSSYLTETWLPHAATRVRPTTPRRYEGLVRVQIAPRIGRVKLAKLRPHHVQSVLDGMIADGAAPASVLQAHRVLSAALTQAVRWQLVSMNPCAALRPPRPERARLQVPTSEQVRTIMDAARGKVYEVPLTLAATTGARRGEVLGLHWSETDLDAGLVRITTTLQKVNGTATFVDPKTARELAARSACPLRRWRCCADTGRNRSSAACCSEPRGWTRTSSWTAATAPTWIPTRSGTPSRGSPGTSDSPGCGCTICAIASPRCFSRQG